MRPPIFTGGIVENTVNPTRIRSGFNEAPIFTGGIRPVSDVPATSGSGLQ